MKRTWASASSSACLTVNPNRVILLLDLDCFYAQCEVIRLGIDKSLPVCLMQWDAALAVNYPAREFGIKRGDTFQIIHEKSGGKCISLHLPVKSYDDVVESDRVDEESSLLHTRKEGLLLQNHPNAVPSDCHPHEHDTESILPTAAAHDEAILNDSNPILPEEEEEDKFKPENQPDLADITETFDGESSLDDSYKREYCLSRERQLELFEREKNAMKEMNALRNHGKASLDRYRLASAKIFDVILKALVFHLGKDQFVFERASIDELFIDITKRCYEFDIPAWGAHDDDSVAAVHETTLYGNLTYDMVNMDEEDKALIRGCEIARGIRRSVFNDLGFTMSAGIGQAKTFAKLAASFGKPNGQAVIFPQALTKLINQTQIRKVRNLGGKIGKKVLSLLPQSEDNLGSIARLLTMEVLSKHLGQSTAKMVLDLSHGIDEEAVKTTVGALPKSITSFKSFPQIFELAGLEKWLNLLANDIISRVDIDCKRNHRYPKTCTLHIHSSNDPQWNYGSSVRIPFPNNLSTNSASARIEQIKVRVRGIIQSKAKFPINRIGLCATNFEARVKTGTITTFFGNVGAKTAISPSQETGVLQLGPIQEEKSQLHNKLPYKSSVLSRVHEDKSGLRSYFLPLSTKNGDSIQSFAPSIHERVETKLVRDKNPCSATAEGREVLPLDHDEEYARQLQASFDRENALLTMVEQRHHHSQANPATDRRNTTTKGRIDSFFSTSKMKKT